MTPISRTQAWCALTIAMVDRELPAPRQITMDSEGAVVSLSTADDFGRWADALGADKRQPSVHTTATVYSTSVLLDGLSLALSAIVTRTPPEPVTEDLTRVREIAQGEQPDPESDAARLGVSVEAMDEALLALAAGLNARPELLDDEAVSGG